MIEGISKEVDKLRAEELSAINKKDTQLISHFRELRLIKELEIVRYIKNGNIQAKLFNPEKHNKIKAVSMEKVGLDYIPLIKGAYNILAGRGGSGKSAIALKSMLLWLNVNSTKNAMAFFTEDAIEEIKLRARIICHTTQLDVKLLDRIDFISLDNDDRIKWVSSSRDGYLINDGYINEVVKHCKDNKIEYIILDPLKRFHRLNENSNDDMDVLVRDCFTKLAVETNAVLLVLHHSAKDAAGGARGASTITDSARMAWRIGKYYMKDNDSGEIKEVEEKKHKVRLDVIKDNMGIENLCQIRNDGDKSIFNPLKANDVNSSQPIMIEFDNKEDEEKLDSSFDVSCFDNF